MGWMRREWTWGVQIKDQGKTMVAQIRGIDGHKREADGYDKYLVYTISKFNSHWIIHLNINTKTIRLLEGSIANILMVLDLAKLS